LEMQDFKKELSTKNEPIWICMQTLYILAREKFA
jgi:hypothetical protein